LAASCLATQTRLLISLWTPQVLSLQPMALLAHQAATSEGPFQPQSPADAKAAAEAQLADAEVARDALKLMASAAKVKQMEAEKFESDASEEAVKLRQALNLLEQETETQAASLAALHQGEDEVIVKRMSSLQKELKDCRAQAAAAELGLDRMTKAAEALERTVGEREIERDALERRLLNAKAEMTQVAEQAQAAAAAARAQQNAELQIMTDAAAAKAAGVFAPAAAAAAAAAEASANEAAAGAAYYSAAAESKLVAAQASQLVAEGRA